MLDITAQDMDEIIALQINGEIYGKHSAVFMAKLTGNVERVYSRAVFKFMADMDVGIKWKEWSEFPTLFTMTEYNKFCKETKND